MLIFFLDRALDRNIWCYFNDPRLRKTYGYVIDELSKVASSKYCAAGLKIGQKIIITGSRIDTEASDCPLCPGVLGPLAGKSQVYLDRCSSNRDLTAPMGAVACVDPGLDAGGLGSVTLKVRIEPVP